MNLEEFNKILDNNEIVVVDFYASWCGPCKMYKPIFEEVMKERNDIKMLTINVDEDFSIADKYNISSIPNTLMFKNGRVLKNKLGYMSKESLIQYIEGEK